MRNRRGWTRRGPAEQIALATRILDNRHEADIVDRARAALGERTNILGPVDLSRNTLDSAVTRLARAFFPPPLVDDLSEALATAMGDTSARTMVESYGKAGGRPMPTGLIQAGHEALRYRLGVGYAGILIDYSERSGRIILHTVAPDAMRLTWADDPQEPAIIAADSIRGVRGQAREVVEVYDLSDMNAPSYRVMLGDEDVTAEVLGESYSGEAYPWRYADGRPFHRVVVTGTDRQPYRTMTLVEATLIVAVRWTSWGAAVDDAGFPQRNVRGLQLSGARASLADGERRLGTGPETILQWTDIDPERPGDHWQDGPGYDPEIIARAIRTYEAAAMSGLGLPVDLEGTGGEPTETERLAVEEAIQGTYPEARRHCGEVLRRCAALANRIPQVGASGLSEAPYSCLFREEIHEAMPDDPAEDAAETKDGDEA